MKRVFTLKDQPHLWSVTPRDFRFGIVDGDLLREEISRTRRRDCRESYQILNCLNNVTFGPNSSITNIKEENRNRDIEPTEPRKKLLSGYVNTSCALYNDGITVLEIANGELRLVT